MSVCTVAVVVGNPRPRSRTLDLAVRLAALLASDGEPFVVDLADHASSLFEWPSPQLDELGAAVAERQLLIVACPTYKASYTGLLKAFLDRYGARGLAGTVAVPFQTGGDLRHQLAVDTHLRPLLVELGASVPTAGLYIPMGDLDRVDQMLEEWVTANAPLIPVGRGIPGSRARPAPGPGDCRTVPAR